MRQIRVLTGASWALLVFATALVAKQDPVQWTLNPQAAAPPATAGGHAILALKATVQSGWHLYSPTTPPGGPNPTKIQTVTNASLSGFSVFRPQPIRKFDQNFNLDTETYVGEAVFLVQADLKPETKGSVPIAVQTRYQVCSDVTCLPPVKKIVSAEIPVNVAGGSTAWQMPAGYVQVPAVAMVDAAVPAASAAVPASPPLSSTPAAPVHAADGSLALFLLTAFGFGLAALFTPCVFPMIPITVSFFLNQNSTVGTNGRKPWSQAFLFCFGIVVLFTALGFLATAIAGPFGVVQLGSSPWVNGFIACVFFAFALSLLGAFELRLPSGFLTRLDRVSQGGGSAATLLMGLTFSLTSFACIGPIVGPLLISSVQSKGATPVLGMMAFAAGLAAPFFLLALFPSYLNRLPRSGGWMVRVKIVLGFIVLAFVLKYLANVDQVFQLHWLTRERFLAAWIVLFALPGFYLLGLLRMEGIKREESLGVSRALLAALFLTFSISLVPGLFGAKLGDLDAFIPEGTSTSFAGANTTAASAAYKNQLDAALAAAKQQNKLVLINFTGYACTNCHWMKANMFPRPEIQAALKDLVVVDLFTDGTDAESEKNQALEDKKFQTAAIPFYAIIDPEQNVIATFPQLTRDTKQFQAFLTTRGSKAQSTAMLR